MEEQSENTSSFDQGQLRIPKEKQIKNDPSKESINEENSVFVCTHKLKEEFVSISEQKRSDEFFIRKKNAADTGAAKSSSTTQSLEEVTKKKSVLEDPLCFNTSKEYGSIIDTHFITSGKHFLLGNTYIYEKEENSIQNQKQVTKKVNPTEGKRQKNKELRIAGKQYTAKVRTPRGQNNKDQIRPPKELGPRCNHQLTKAKPSKIGAKSSIKFNVSRSFLCASIDDNLREKIFKDFWSLVTWDLKRMYVTSLVKRRDPYRRRSKGVDMRKNNSFDCFFDNCDGVRVRVCKTFFLNTLSLGRDSFHRWVVDQI